MPVSTKTPSSSKSKSKPTAKAPSKAPAKAAAAMAKTAAKASVNSVEPQEVVEVKPKSKKAPAKATSSKATKADLKAKASDPAKVESKPADKTKAKAKSAAKASVKSAEPQEVVEVKAASKKAPAKATATKVASKAKAKASEPAKAETKAKAKSAAKASVKSAEPQEVVEVKAPSKKAPAKVATATKADSKAKVSEPVKVESKSTANAKGAAKASVKSVEPQEVVEVKAKSKKAPSKAAATKVASKAKAKASEPAKVESKPAAKAAKSGAKAKVVAKGYEVYAEPSEGVEAEFKDITLLNKEERYELMRLLQDQNPNPKSELEFKNTFELLCAVVLSAQATDASVNKATPALFKAAPDPKSMAKLGAEGIAPYIQSIGLWKNKAKFLAQLSQALLDKHDGKVPGSFDELVALPGVGSKTAKVVLNVAFGQPFIAVDTHVYRVATRTGLCLGKCPGQVEERISPLVAEPFLKEAHHYLLLHGRYNCTAQRFEGHCDKCVVAKYCKHNYERKEK